MNESLNWKTKKATQRRLIFFSLTRFLVNVGPSPAWIDRNKKTLLPAQRHHIKKKRKKENENKTYFVEKKYVKILIIKQRIYKMYQNKFKIF